MPAAHLHKAKIQEHLQELKDAIAIGIELRPATIGFHTSACSIELLELYLHKTGKIPIGAQVKHEWFKRPLPNQKITPLAERKLRAEFASKTDILDLLCTIEKKRNKLIYGKSDKADIKELVETFTKYKEILFKLLCEAGENLEDANN